MTTVVYLANQQIQVVVGTPGDKKIRINVCYTESAPEGSIINGMVMDTELFVGFMQEFWKAHRLPTKDVVLVTNSNKFVGKNFEIPVLNDKKSMEFIEREFTDVNKEEAHIYGYIPIGGDKKLRKVYAESITPDFIKDYIDIFSEIGVKLSAIYSGETSLISLATMTVAQQYQTFVMQLTDGMMITTLLWVDGTFYYFNSTRCFHDQGTEDYANDIARSVSQITQFMQANQIESQLEAVVMAGVAPADLGMYQEAIGQIGVQAPVRLFADQRISSPSEDVQKFLYAASGLVANGKKQNFLVQYQQVRKKEKKQKGSGKDLIMIGVIFLIMVSLLGISMIFRAAKKRELQDLKDYNEDPINVMDIARYDVLMERNAFLSAQYNAIHVIDDNLYTYPLGNQEVIRIIESCARGYAEITMDSFDANQGQISMSATSDTVDNINKFIGKLDEQDIFNSVNYTGYSFRSDINMWDIHVTCILKESAGRPAKEGTTDAVGNDGE